MTASNIQQADIIIVGSGLAGLVCALALAPRPVMVITKTSQLAGGSSWWAQGGIAVALGPDDSPLQHAADTVAAGAGLSEPGNVQRLTEDAVHGIDWLVAQGVQFDKTAGGTLSLAREAAHQAARVIHAGGDATGQSVIQTLVNRVNATPSIQVLTDTFVDDLVISGNRVQGVTACNHEHGWHQRAAAHVILATGGIGSLWLQTTNPPEATGDGLAMAARAGAELTDLEFMQFHPTALAYNLEGGASNLPLLTEALRGAGAVLIDETGERFMLAEHDAGDLAPRDIVARAIYRRMHSGQRVYLDLRPIFRSGKSASFPRALELARQYGFNPASEPLPVTPAAHYHMGGVTTDTDGRTSVSGLWACGEVAATGVHGANRLASNSLLEALIYARRIASAIEATVALPNTLQDAAPDRLNEAMLVDGNSASIFSIAQTLRSVLWQRVGILRTGRDLQLALASLNDLQSEFDKLQRHTVPMRQWGETRNSLLIARMLALAALRREESRGAHYRDDFPYPLQHWRHRQVMNITATEIPDHP